MRATKCCACTTPATHIPKLVFVAFRGAGASFMFADRPSCPAHHPAVADLVSDQDWPRIMVAIMAHGKLAPKRELTTIEMVPIKGHEAREFYDALKRSKQAPDTDRLKLTAPFKVH